MNDFFKGEWEDNDKPLYTKITTGSEVRLRVLSRAVVGQEGWYMSKPVRFDSMFKINADQYATLDKDTYDSSKSKWRQFAVCVVYNYTTDAVQFWQFTQKQVRDGLERLSKDADWGDLSTYDIKVKREGEGIETKYTITPLPKKPLTSEVSAMVANAGLTPEMIFTDAKNHSNIETFLADADKRTPSVNTDVPFD
jgi:hypothetical protein